MWVKYHDQDKFIEVPDKKKKKKRKTKKVVKTKKKRKKSYLENRTKKNKYNRYIASKEWKEKRQWILERDEYKCRCCGENKNLEVHHLNYDNLFNELDTDLITLCEKCHKNTHKELKDIKGNY